MPQRICSSVGAAFFCNRAYDDINIPGVQNPHGSPCSSLKPSCNGWSAPLLGRPSTVMTSAPSACTANMVHDFTVFPFKSTVQAPQLLVSQPTCVPVNPSCSRIKCTSSSLGSAATSRSLPLILSLISSFFAMPHVLRFAAWKMLLACPFSGARQSTLGKLFNKTCLVGCRT